MLNYKRMSISRKKSLFFKLSALFVFIPTLYLLTSSFILNGDDGLKIGKTMPMSSSEMMGVDKKQHSLETLKKSNGIVVVFSCNTCPFVIGNDGFEGWENQYNNLSKTASKKDLGFVLVNSNEAKRDGDDSLDEMIKHAKEANYNMPYVVDQDSKLADAFGAKTTPHVFVFNSKNELIYKGSIDNIWDSKRNETVPYLKNVMDHLTDDIKIIEESTPPRGCSIKRTK